MADRVINNPHLEVMPDHAGPHYEILQNALTLNGMNVEQAVQALNESWMLNHHDLTQRWDQQELEDANAAEGLQRQIQQEEEQRAAQQLPERAENRMETEKKKAKTIEFDDTSIVGNYIAPRPAQYAIRRLEDFKFIKLWYLTPEGCSNATSHQHTQNDDTFGLTKVDDMVTLKSVSSLKASKNVVADSELTFHQMSMAKNALIPLMTKHLWPEKAIRAFAQFFKQLELHPFRQCEFGKQALITYQAHIHREWHDQLKLGKAFNIGAFNEDLLQSIYKEILDKSQLQSLNEVSTTSPLNYIAITNYFRSSPLHFLNTSHLNSCTMHHAPRNMHHAPRIMHHAPCHHTC